MIFLPRCAAALAPLACGANGRQAMGCLRLREAANAHFRLEATDGKVLGILRGPSSPSAAERRAAESLPEPECLALEALLPRKGFQEAMRPLKGEARLGVRLARPQTLLVAGADKAQRLEEILTDRTGQARFPVERIAPADELVWWIDRAAAANLPAAVRDGEQVELPLG